MREKFAVIDTETTWNNELMSIGLVIGDSGSFEQVDKRYYILLPSKDYGGMYASALYMKDAAPDLEASRRTVVAEIRKFLLENSVSKIFAYNALFDYGQLRELRAFQWYDIMKLAAYRRYNSSIPESADCFKTGRLKRGFGVENIYRLLSGDSFYCETHNALLDAVDELAIMKMLNLDFATFCEGRL